MAGLGVAAVIAVAVYFLFFNGSASPEAAAMSTEITAADAGGNTASAPTGTTQATGNATKTSTIQGIINDSIVNMRSSPNGDTIIQQLVIGDTIQIIGTNKGWYDTGNGWVSKNLVKVVVDKATGLPVSNKSYAVVPMQNPAIEGKDPARDQLLTDLD